MDEILAILLIEDLLVGHQQGNQKKARQKICW